MPKLTSEEYFGLDEFLRDAFRRVEAGQVSAEDAHSHALHAITAFDKGNQSGFVPYLRMIRKEWADENG
ncbi:hypothetical protein [Sphingosinicella terrae]|uniref:hypothetical protein n=1 Tax=Sphingosinicella terrae TaxID=2172047 RepID=UPI000E0DC67A|nr:hypothetical protein [Sphingosinicella terrae]